MNRNRRRRAIAALAPAFVGLAGIYEGASPRPATTRPADIGGLALDRPHAFTTPANKPDCRNLRLMNLNLAHGRGEAFHQLFLPTSRLQDNLDAVAQAIRGAGVDAVALQEADDISAWSGRFNHVRWLAERTPMPAYAQARQIDGLGLRYGTALMSRLAMDSAEAMTFPSRAPWPAKGMTTATLSLNGRELDLVSLHLDFASARLRRAQADALLQQLAGRGRPLVIMGDFNEGWSEGSSVQRIARHLGLHTPEPENSDWITFPKLGRRIDWVLASEHLEFRSLETLEAPLSDHRALVAELSWRDPAPACLTTADTGR
jgi:endonuclease/exonuclease/phosphatase family metal-dependent hydrolase